MNRPLAILATSAALTLAGVLPGTALAADAAASPSVPGTCATSYRGVVVNEICAIVSGDQVTFHGRTTPTSVSWTPRPVPFRLTARIVDGAEIGTVTQTVNVSWSATPVGRISGALPCGSTAEATLETTQWGWPPAAVTLSVAASC
ncbi:hypothetical protein ACIPYS_29240 [Kitasatospora sp. NPDC089913]|uniref:hypothetical protein n=1 Tax=Streptomycetaceae TaxID=2062 RepID=UPI00087984D7|nr:hypothetical protein [Streptomyces sp. TLI_053]SDT82874.1 hypothetical protein SAMN05216371_7681 [Streptomyces sp. TLI_053]